MSKTISKQISFSSAGAIVLCLVFSQVVSAYETDVHYGLTFWLSTQAGFSPEEAHEIARGNQLMDHGKSSAIHLILWKVCLEVGDDDKEEASKLVRDYHFRSDENVPNHPRDRPVKAAGNYANQMVEEIVKEKDPKDYLDLLFWFGQALHGFQDSYSHQGRSSIILGVCASDYIWSHPFARGGFWSHDADLTFKKFNGQSGAIPMALDTYNYLLELKKYQNRKYPKEVEWAKIEQAVHTFARLDNKTEKQQWLKDYNVPSTREIMKNTNLKSGRNGAQYYWESDELDLDPWTDRQFYEFENLQRIILNEQLAILRKYPPPAGADGVTNKILEKWRADESLDEWILVDRLPTLNGEEISLELLMRFIKASIYPEHGEINLVDHGLIQGELPALSEKWFEVYTVSVNPELPYVIARVNNPDHIDEAVAGFSFAHAQNDLILLTIEKYQDSYYIKDITSVVIH